MSVINDVVRVGTRPARSQYYRRGRGRSIVARLPGRIRRAAGLDDDGAVVSGRVQIGPRPDPLRGYLHVGTNWRDPTADFTSPPWRLALRDRTASEIVAIGVLDRLDPFVISCALVHWRRVLRPDGRLVVGVDDQSTALGVVASRQSLWGRQPGARGDETSPLQLTGGGERTLFTEDFLRHVLETAGFAVRWTMSSASDSRTVPLDVDWPGAAAIPENILVATPIVAVCSVR